MGCWTSTVRVKGEGKTPYNNELEKIIIEHVRCYRDGPYYKNWSMFFSHILRLLFFAAGTYHLQLLDVLCLFRPYIPVSCYIYYKRTDHTWKHPSAPQGGRSLFPRLLLRTPFFSFLLLLFFLLVAISFFFFYC